MSALTPTLNPEPSKSIMVFAGRAGNWVLLEGLDATITKTATLVPEFLDEDVHIIRPLQFHTQVRGTST